MAECSGTSIAARGDALAGEEAGDEHVPPALELPRPRGWAMLLTRLLSLLALAAVLTLFARCAGSAYRAFTDGLVTPIVLSPESETVIQTKVGYSRLVSEREALLARIDGSKATVETLDGAVELLNGLLESSPGDRGLAAAFTGGQAVADLSAMRDEQALLAARVKRQQRYVAEVERDLAAGLVRKADLEREQQALNHARVALLQQRPQVVRVGVELLKFDAERRASLAQQRADQNALARLDDLLAQMKERPIWRAIETSQDVAFVPYRQMEKVHRGDSVYSCPVWGLFGCSAAGRVLEVLPGEVVSQDAWGGVARGQYAVLALSDPSAARERSLRVRPGRRGVVEAGGQAHLSAQ